MLYEGETSAVTETKPEAQRDNQLLRLLIGGLEVALLSWLAKELSGLAGAFACFGFLISRLLRFCPLAMAEGPFD